MTAPTQATAREAVELPPFSPLVSHMLRDYVPSSVELQVAVAIREYAKTYGSSLLAAKQEELDKMRGALSDARNYVEASSLNASGPKTRQNYRGCLARINAALNQGGPK